MNVSETLKNHEQNQNSDNSNGWENFPPFDPKKAQAAQEAELERMKEVVQGVKIKNAYEAAQEKEVGRITQEFDEPAFKMNPDMRPSSMFGNHIKDKVTEFSDRTTEDYEYPLLSSDGDVIGEMTAHNEKFDDGVLAYSSKLQMLGRPGSGVEMIYLSVEGNEDGDTSYLKQTVEAFRPDGGSSKEELSVAGGKEIYSRYDGDRLIERIVKIGDNKFNKVIYDENGKPSAPIILDENTTFAHPGHGMMKGVVTNSFLYDTIKASLPTYKTPSLPPAMQKSLDNFYD